MKGAIVAAVAALCGGYSCQCPYQPPSLIERPGNMFGPRYSGGRRKPHNRGRCTRATPAGVSRSCSGGRVRLDICMMPPGTFVVVDSHGGQAFGRVKGESADGTYIVQLFNRCRQEWTKPAPLKLSRFRRQAAADELPRVSEWWRNFGDPAHGKQEGQAGRVAGRDINAAV